MSEERHASSANAVSGTAVKAEEQQTCAEEAVAKVLGAVIESVSAPVVDAPPQSSEPTADARKAEEVNNDDIIPAAKPVEINKVEKYAEPADSAEPIESIIPAAKPVEMNRVEEYAKPADAEEPIENTIRAAKPDEMNKVEEYAKPADPAEPIESTDDEHTAAIEAAYAAGYTAAKEKLEKEKNDLVARAVEEHELWSVSQPVD